MAAFLLVAVVSRASSSSSTFSIVHREGGHVFPKIVYYKSKSKEDYTYGIIIVLVLSFLFYRRTSSSMCFCEGASLVMDAVSASRALVAS